MTRDAVCCRSLTLSQRGEHDIEHELVFSNHRGYVFHDSRGIESGATDEVDILKGFIQTKASARRLQSRLHVIWCGCVLTMMTSNAYIFRYCIPMDNQRPELELKRFKDIYQYSDQKGESSSKLVTL